MDIEFVRSRFIKHFDGKTGNIYQSPGRINLIGEHTDYNGGFVFPGKENDEKERGAGCADGSRCADHPNARHR